MKSYCSAAPVSRKANGWRSLMWAVRSKLTGSIVASGVSANWPGPNRGPANTTSPPPNSRTNSSAIWQNRGLKAAAGKSPRKITS